MIMEPGLKLYSQPHPSIEWTMERPDNRCRMSEEFLAGNNTCYLSANNLSINGDDFYQLHFHVKDYSSDPFQVTAFLSTGSGLFLPQTTTIQHHGGHLIWQAGRFKVFKVERLRHFHRQTMWRFWVVIHMRRRSYTVEKSVQTPAHLDDHLKFEALSSGSTQLLNEGPNQDLEIICGGRSFRAHGSLLSSRSDVFSAMLQSDMLEGKTRQVRIRDIEPDLFGLFLGYLYNGRLPDLTVDRAMRLFEVADKYAVQDLKDQCSSFLTDSLARSNACGILTLADRHSDAVLKESAVLYILKEEIPLCKELWSEFADCYPKLAVEVYKRFHQ